jgi:hypothetical protein
MHCSTLGEQAGDFLFQVNLFSEKAASLASTYEQISEERRKPFTDRIHRTREALRGLALDYRPLQALYGLLGSRTGGEFAYANVDVKAHLAARLGLDGLEAWVGPGPAPGPDHANLSDCVTIQRSLQ